MQLQQMRERMRTNWNGVEQRRARAGFAIAGTWGVAFAPVTGVASAAAFVLAGPVIWHRMIEGIGVAGLVGLILLMGFMMGILSGVFFSLVLGIAERGRGVATVPLWRATLWGAAAGPLVVSLLWARGLLDHGPYHVPTTVWLILGAGLSICGAVMGTLTLAAAKRAQ